MPVCEQVTNDNVLGPDSEGSTEVFSVFDLSIAKGIGKNISTSISESY